MLGIFFAFLFTTIFWSPCICAVEFPQCDNAPTGSFIAVANNCSKAVYCNGPKSDILNCGEESPYFSPEDQKCHSSYSVCGNRPFKIFNTPTTIPPTTLTTAATISSNFPANTDATTTTTTISSVVTSTNAATTELLIANTTSNEQSSPTTPTPNQAGTTVKESSTSAVFTTSSIKITTSTEVVPAVVQCPAVDNPKKPLFIPHTRSCSKYYLCYHGVATLMKCPNKLHFDVTQQSCNTPERSKCQVNSLSPRIKCQMHTLSFHPHPTNCNYYYLCEYGFLMVMQCPFNMHYDYKHQVCVMRSMAKCYNVNSTYVY